MKTTQGKSVFGFVTFCIQGNQPELFFQYCQKRHIIVWDIEQIDHDTYSASVSWHNRKKIISLGNELSYTFSQIQPRGVLPILIQKSSRKEIWMALLLSIIVVFMSVNTVWKLEVTGVSKEMDVKIRHELKSAGLYPGAWGYQMENLDLLQQRLLKTIPDLLYIGIHKQGTTYHVDAVEKLKETKERSNASKQLIATKDGIIDKMHIISGIPQVQVQDFVKKGDVLISGWMEKEEENEGEATWIGAEGKVYANTWYEVSIDVPKYSLSEEITGKKHDTYGMAIGKYEIPIWGFGKHEFDEYFVEKEFIPLQLFSWELPVSFWKEVAYDKSKLSMEYNDQEVRKIAIDYISYELRRELGQDTEILDYNILHETPRNGKVNLNLYISVIEDIAKNNDKK